MKDWFNSTLDNLSPIAITALAIYIVLIIFTRLAGKRSFSKMSSFDFAITVSIGSILATAILSKSVSLEQAVWGLASIYLIQMGSASLRRYGWFRKLIDNPPLLLMDGQEILFENLKKAKVTESDLKSKLREANVIELSEVKAVIFESTGDISVLHASDREKKMDDYIMDGVRMK